MITKSILNTGPAQIETPKKYFNVKANQSGQKVKMQVEHHSAGFRPKTDESPTKSPNKMREPTGANSLSQISSVVSEKEGSPKKYG